MSNKEARIVADISIMCCSYTITMTVCTDGDLAGKNVQQQLLLYLSRAMRCISLVQSYAVSVQPAKQATYSSR